MTTPSIAVLMGSDSDVPVMQATLNQLQVPWKAKITSAHRTPDAMHHYVTNADRRGCAAFTATGLAAQILALGDPELSERVKAERTANVRAVIAKDADLQSKLGK